MASSYPTNLDTSATFPTDVTDDTDSKAGTPRTGLKGFLAQWVDDTSDAIVRIETELGTLPKGPYADVAARLNTLGAKITATAATTANISPAINPGGLSLVVDGVTLQNGDVLLMKDQTAPAENGLRLVSGVGVNVALTRIVEADTGAEIADLDVGVSQGVVNADTRWRQVTSPPITIDTTPLRWTRTHPPYQPFQRNPWAPGATPPLLVNADRDSATASVAQTVITAITSLHSGMVLRAGTAYSNINSFCTAIGSGTVTTNWYALVRQSDRQVLRATANSTALPALGVYTRALTSPYTADVDTPVWVAWATQVATTSPAFAGQAALTALVQPFALVAPIFQGNSTTGPGSTPPTAGTVLGAPTTATSGRLYFWLT